MQEMSPHRHPVVRTNILEQRIQAIKFHPKQSLEPNPSLEMKR
jgi:hypothetical protein